MPSCNRSGGVRYPKVFMARDEISLRRLRFIIVRGGMVSFIKNGKIAEIFYLNRGILAQRQYLLFSVRLFLD